MKRNCITLILSAILLAPLAVSGQADIHFSQFYETSILRNPALTGIFPEDYKVGVYERNQWASIIHPYQTTLINGETHIAVSHRSDDFFSFGFLGYADKAGSINQSIVGLYPAISFNKSMNPEHHSYLSAGFTSGYLQYSYDPSKATFNNQYQNNSFNALNPSGENLPNPKLEMWDVGTGLNFNTSGRDAANTFIVGLSAYHITKPKFSYYLADPQNVNIRVNSNFALSRQINESFVMQLQANATFQGTYREVLLGGLLGWTEVMRASYPVFVFYAGAFYRVGDAVIPVVKVKYKNFALGMSYDVNVSTLSPVTNLQGGYEVTLFYTGFYPRNFENTGKICPRF
jgi:type IX secretion system PorP/SprF family membrane protein